MQFRLVLALSISILLIGVASWSRFTILGKTPAGIIAVEQLGTSDNDYSEIINDFIEPKTASTTPRETPLSGTDLIGRRLILDYIGLAASGEVTEANIAALADQYVKSVPTLNQAVVINPTDIKAVSNSQSNFQNYANTLTKIHSEYAERVGNAYAGGNSINDLGPELYSFTSTFSSAYTNAAVKLQNLSVPASLVPTHLEVVNSYLSSAAAMKAISEAEQDSVAAFAGLITLKENASKEDALLNEISRILTSNGI